MIAAVDIGGTKIAVGIVDRWSRAITSECRRKPDAGYANALDQDGEHVARYVRPHGRTSHRHWHRIHRTRISIYGRVRRR